MSSRPRRRRRDGRRRLLALLAVAVALLVGVLVGYAARGEPPEASPFTVEREVPVVTVTVTTPAP
jgi:hypothetical protein